MTSYSNVQIHTLPNDIYRPHLTYAYVQNHTLPIHMCRTTPYLYTCAAYQQQAHTELSLQCGHSAHVENEHMLIITVHIDSVYVKENT